MKKTNLTISIILVIAVVLGAIWLVNKSAGPEPNIESKCQVKKITFYYLDNCDFCNKVKQEGTISKIEGLGVKVDKINASVGPVRHNFEEVPTFVIDNKVYEGYRTFGEIKELLVCPDEGKISDSSAGASSGIDLGQNVNLPSGINFLGEKGKNVVFNNGEIELSASLFNDNQARFYNVAMPSGKTIYFFVVKDRNGIYRAAANACAVCFKTYKGFRQEGDEIVCNNCGNRYPIEKIATEKGGCNPGPVSPNLQVENGRIIIRQADLEKVLNLF